MNFLMHKYKAFIDSNLESRKVFILGCGRSGTHWMGYILKKHRDVYVTIEKKGIFDKVTEMAVDPSRKKQLLKIFFRILRAIVQYYRVMKMNPGGYPRSTHGTNNITFFNFLSDFDKHFIKMSIKRLISVFMLNNDTETQATSPTGVCNNTICGSNYWLTT